MTGNLTELVKERFILRRTHFKECPTLIDIYTYIGFKNSYSKLLVDSIMLSISKRQDL